MGIACATKEYDGLDGLKKFAEIHYSQLNEYEGNIFIYSKREYFENGKKRTRMTIAKTIKTGASFGSELSQIRQNPERDYYLTANAFFGGRRFKRCLYKLMNIVIDIDYHRIFNDKEKEFRDEMLDKIVQDLSPQLCDVYDIPYPNTVVKTGRGLQLWIRLEDCSAKLKDSLYQPVAQIIAQNMQNLLVDYSNRFSSGFSVDFVATTNPAGLFRLPGSRNTKTGERGTFFFNHDSPYDLLNLYKTLKKGKKENGGENHVTYTKTRRSKTQRSKTRRAKAKGKSGNELLNKRYSQLMYLISLRKKYGRTIERDKFLLIAYCSLCGLGLTEEEILEKVAEMNASFPNPLRENEWLNYLSSAFKKKYRFRNTTIISWLNITAEEQKEIKLKAVNDSFKCAEEKEKRRVEQTDTIVTLAQQGKNKKEIAKAVGCSEKTVARRLADREVKTDNEKRTIEMFRDVEKGATAIDLVEKYRISKSLAYRVAALARKQMAIYALFRSTTKFFWRYSKKQKAPCSSRFFSKKQGFHEMATSLYSCTYYSAPDRSKSYASIDIFTFFGVEPILTELGAIILKKVSS